jgi:cytochrome c oxidase subunit 4
MSVKASPHAVVEKPIDKSAEVRVYLTIFAALAVLTLMTVGVAYMNLPHAAGVVIALVIAAVKVFLIASFFMHLRSEGRLINVGVGVCLALVLILVVFVLPDLGVHPLEEAARRAMHDIESQPNLHYPALAPEGAEAPPAH